MILRIATDLAYSIYLLLGPELIMPSCVTAVWAVTWEPFTLETRAKFYLEVPFTIRLRALASRETVPVRWDPDRDTVAETAKMVHQCVAPARFAPSSHSLTNSLVSSITSLPVLSRT